MSGDSMNERAREVCLPGESRRLKTLVALCAVLAMGASASAQTIGSWVETPASPVPPPLIASSQSIDAVRKEYPMHVGPVFLKPGLLLRELGVDSNVFNDGSDPKSDFVAVLTPSLEAVVTIARRALVRTSGGVDLVYYHKYANQRSIDPRGAIQAEVYANRVSFFANASLVNTKQRDNFDVDLRLRHQNATLNGGVSVRVTPKTHVDAAVHYGEFAYASDSTVAGDVLERNLDHTTRGFTLTTRHKLTPLTTVVGLYDNLHDRFPNVPLRDADSYRVMGGFEFKPRALITGTAYVGYRHFTPLSSALPVFSGVISRLSLSCTFFGGTMVGVAADRDVGFSVDELSPYYVDDGIAVYVRQALGGDFDVMADAGRHTYNYRSLESLVEAGRPARIDTTDGTGVSLGYSIRHKTRVGVGARYISRRSNVIQARNYNGLRYGALVTVGF